MKKMILFIVTIWINQSAFAQISVCKNIYQDAVYKKLTLIPIVDQWDSAYLTFSFDLIADDSIKLDTVTSINEEWSVIGRSVNYSFTNQKSKNTNLITLTLSGKVNKNEAIPIKLFDATLVNSQKSVYDKGLSTTVDHYKCKMIP